MSAKLRNELRHVIATWVMGSFETSRITNTIDNMLNNGMDDQSLIDTIYKLEGIWSPKIPATIQELIDGLNLSPSNLMAPVIAAQVLAHAAFENMLKEDDPIKIWRIYDKLAWRDLAHMHCFDDNYRDFLYLIRELDSYWFERNEDGTRYVYEKDKWYIRKKPSVGLALAQFLEALVSLDETLPNSIKDPA